jgi:hypothetical protein
MFLRPVDAAPSDDLPVRNAPGPAAIVAATATVHPLSSARYVPQPMRPATVTTTEGAEFDFNRLFDGML